jgi:nucleoside 2-deoxyribosyltransferase
MVIYLAGPLFSESERAWLRALIERIEAATGAQVYWSWERHGGRQDSVEGIFETCREGLDSADAMLAILDGPQVDDGTAWEMGYFYARWQGARPIVGLRTDLRRAGELDASVVNAMIQAGCDVVARDTDEALAALGALIKRKAPSAGRR